jgi:hypothetical protein
MINPEEGGNGGDDNGVGGGGRTGAEHFLSKDEMSKP